MISIRQPLSFSEIGRKDNQEDYLYPQNASTVTRTFILCDGMGGHDNGEVASRTAAEALGTFLSSCSEIDVPTFETGLEKAYEALDLMGGPSVKKPGTTMACLCLNEDSYLVAHIGDSRVYHIRPSLYNPKLQSGGILYQSSDHSLVNDLLKAGEITEEEARDFPQKNIITRAMQPLDKRYKADVYMFDDIREGDYFFLCCDGVLEQLTNTMLCEILADRYLNDTQKLERIKRICDGNTHDNYSCWLVPVDKVSLSPRQSNADVIMADMNETQSQKIEQNEPAEVQPIPQIILPTAVVRRSARRVTCWLMIDILFIILCSLFIIWKAFLVKPVQKGRIEIEQVDTRTKIMPGESDGPKMIVNEAAATEAQKSDQEKASEAQTALPPGAPEKGMGKSKEENTDNATEGKH